MTIPNNAGKTKSNARIHVNAAVRVEAVPITPLLPEAERFPEGTRLYHAHHDAVVEVLKDSGGTYIYVKYVGTDCQQYAPRGALALRAKDQKKVKKSAAGVNIAQPETKPKRTIKKTPEEALAAELLADYMREKVTDRESVDKVARRNKVEVPPADKPFGLAKMQLMNSLRRMVKAGGKLK